MMTKMIYIAKWVLYLLVFAFLGLMVVEWGMDYSGLSRRSQFIVGEINGHEISKDEFDRAVQIAYENEQVRTGQDLSEEQVKELRSRVWEDLVRRIILSKEIERLNIKVTNEDVVNYIVNNPPPAVMQNENFQTNGRFDRSKYLNALMAPENRENLIYQEQLLKSELPYLKLEQLIMSSVMVTEEEIRDEFMRQNMKAKIEYLAIPLAAFRDRQVPVSEEEARNYYQSHKEEFKVEEQRQLSYVLFPTIPTAEDSADVLRRAESIKREAQEGKDFKELADLYSEDPSVVNNHGDLGYFERRTMVKEFSDAAFSAKPGEIVGPVKTQFGVHIIKVFDRKKEKGKEKVHAAHILLKFEPSRYTLDNAYESAYNFSEQARENGFTVTADELNYEIKKTPEFTFNKIGNIPALGRSEAALMWAFDAEKGDISDVFQFPIGYAVLEVTEIKPAGYKPFEEVKDICKSKVRLEKQKDIARQFAEQWRDEVKNTGDFKAVAAMDTSHLMVVDSTDEFSMNVFVPKIGKAPQVVAAAFSLPIGEISDLLEADRGFYYIRVLKRTEFDEEQYAQKRKEIRTRLLQQKQRNAFSEWYNRLKEKSNIVDRRYMFYRS
ncbi:MAG: hypothetical protein D6748_01545 [Calditrichaeota bacterium]|nr:MAG: hypothetical protein D6748_01545 [Calditrichota bacterium]